MHKVLRTDADECIPKPQIMQEALRMDAENSKKGKIDCGAAGSPGVKTAPGGRTKVLAPGAALLGVPAD